MRRVTDLRVSSGHRNRSKGTWMFVVALLLLGVSGDLAEAQFNGPPSNASLSINRPMVPTTDPAILYPTERDIRLSQGDLLLVHLYGAPDYAPPVRVSLDGKIHLPLVGDVVVEGLTIHQTESLITQRLVSAGMYRDPQITVQLTEAPNQYVTVSGELHAVVPVMGERRLFDVLSTAGGLPATASHIITISRQGLAEPIVIDLGTDPAQSAHANVPVFAGDTVIVAKMGVVYLLGAFRTQGPFPLKQNSPLTLMQLAAEGGGPGFEGKYDDLQIIRTIGMDRKVVHVDIKKVFDGTVPDPPLQADDIVFLPTSEMKAAIKSGGISTLMGIASILILAVRP
jgi:polysaccharide biosynthesis/export protein